MSTNIPGTTNAYPALRTNEFFTISIQHIPTGEMVEFEGWVTTFSDNYTSQWNETQVYGRMDPLSTFQGTRRSISLGFDVVNDSLEHGQENLQKIAKFMKFLYPVYSNKTPSIQNVLQGAPLLSIKWTNLISNANGSRLVGYINGGLSYQPDMGEGGFMTPSIPENRSLSFRNRNPIAGIKNYIPKKVSLNFSFTVLHTHLVGWAPSFTPTATLRAMGFNSSFVFGGKKEIQNSFPFVDAGFEEPATLAESPDTKSASDPAGSPGADPDSIAQQAANAGESDAQRALTLQRDAERRLANAPDNAADIGQLNRAFSDASQVVVDQSYSGPDGEIIDE